MRRLKHLLLKRHDMRVVAIQADRRQGGTNVMYLCALCPHRFWRHHEEGEGL